ncbi:MAG: GrpB family protein [Anaerolineaceae bacterium]|nr:GrpB family protein [Anaerolineaceae bacterium]
MDENKREVILESYQPKWKHQFVKEVSTMYPAFWMCWEAVYHIGSTAIPGVIAKPIVDILLIVHDVQKSDLFNDAISELGYTPKGAYGIAGRRYFYKGGALHTVHIHAFESSSPHVDRHLLFRDYLRAHPSAVQAYSALKQELVKQYRYDPEGYSDAKDGFITQMDAEALKWKEESNWVRPDTDWIPEGFV